MILALQNNDSFTFFDHSYLEVFLLHWITESQITIDPPNLDILLHYFKVTEVDNLKDLLLDAIKFSKQVIPNIVPNDQVFKAMGNQNDDNKNKEKIIGKDNRQPYSMNTAMDDIKNEAKLTGEGNRQPNSVNSFVDANLSYKVRKEHAGFLLIINQTKFYREIDTGLEEFLAKEELKPRKGTCKDKDRIIEVFTEFGYKCEVREDLRHDEFDAEVEAAVARSLIKDSLIICVLSHGIKDHVYGSNSIPFEIEKIKKRMVHPALIGKPKILLVQACQGSTTQKPVRILSYLRFFF